MLARAYVRERTRARLRAYTRAYVRERTRIRARASEGASALCGYAVGVPLSRYPRGDELPESPEDWTDVPLGTGQEPRPSSGFQFSRDRGMLPAENDIQRKPGEQTEILLRWPERPY